MTVYVVDDSKDAADSLATLLGVLGHQATAFYSGADVLARVAGNQPDCVMLDVDMVGMNGLEVAQTLRSRFGDDIILVAITGSPSDDPTVKDTFETVDHYFEKPVTLEQIQKLFPG